MLSLAAVRQDQHQVRGLAADARQRQQLLHRRRHAAAEARQDLSQVCLHVDRLVAIEADRIDQPLDLRPRSGCAIVRGVRATWNSRVDAACVTASRVCADSIVAISTWKGSSC